MSRPEYPNCIMPNSVIHHIRQEQEYYDRDPEHYGRVERYYKEQRELEHQQEWEAWEEKQQE